MRRDDGDEGARIHLRQSGLSWRQLDDEIIVLDLENSRYVNLNGTAALIWARMTDGPSIDELVGVLLESYDIDEGRARADAEALVRDLRDLGLLAG